MGMAERLRDKCIKENRHDLIETLDNEIIRRRKEYEDRHPGTLFVW